jgi:hypothetical protein
VNENVPANHGIIGLKGCVCRHIHFFEYHVVMTRGTDAAASDFQRFPDNVNTMHSSMGPDQPSGDQRDLAYAAAQFQDSHTGRYACMAKKAVGQRI